MSTALTRSLAPRTIALIGGVADLSAVIGRLRDSGYPWEIWPVTHEAREVAGIAAAPAIAELPEAPDLAYVALHGAALHAALRALAARGAGAAVCPAVAGLREISPPPLLPVFAGGLLSPAGRLPFWPGVAPLEPVPRGAAVLLSAPQRLGGFLSLRHGLPLSFVLPVAGWSGAGVAALAAEMLADERVTALAIQADRLAPPAEVLELGRLAQKHGKALVFWMPNLGPGPAALLRRAGVSHVTRPAALVEALWILHLIGLPPANALSVTAFGPGLAERAGGLAARYGLQLAPLSRLQEEALRREVPQGRVPDNPLDASGLLEDREQRLARVLAEMMAGAAVLSLGVIRNAGDAGWGRARQAAAAARARVGMPLALLAPNRAEMSEARSQALLAAGVIPLAGLKPALEALRATIEIGSQAPGGGALLMPADAAAELVHHSGAEAGEALGIALCAAQRRGGGLRLLLSSSPAFGYLVELIRPAAPRVSALLPLTPRACRDMAREAGGAGSEAALVSVLKAVQDHVAASEGAVAGLEIVLELRDNLSACARSIELRSWRSA
ncbi:CoA-binding protein [Alloyangia pacifica]|uniref:Acyl-CoA synthetase (NDP forming) n=1 Tax=Alloyangia pacifica TaxID=311180 RepID=A0A1I6PZU7_9RHOB|nr:CoA-binding protein [Alloyangia pacifica]SDG39488.1 Acyl-CoA synthetase (NDP forming) [Alloyangia pacifica]SFS45759.1 Acyl-CoA synthetase (NDP forming) [Alloyangia pacifica]